MNSKTSVERKENLQELNKIDQGKEGVNYFVFIGVSICIAAALIGAYIVGLMPAPKGQLVDCDCYVRLTRVIDLFETGDWYHPAPMKSNTPYGDISPWSRPLDVLLLVGAIPLSTMMGFHDALFWWGVAVTPVLLALTVIALNWSTRSVLSRDGTFLVILMFLSQTVILGYFQPARPDHHGLMILLFVLSLGLMLRLALKSLKRSVCCTAGAVAALSLWVSIESLAPVGLSLGVLGLLWVMQNGDLLKKNLYYSMALFGFSGAAMVLERPLTDLNTIEFDRFSIVYVCLLGLIALFWGGASSVDRRFPILRSRTGRMVYGVLGVTVIALVMWLLFPRFYKGPLADMDPRIIPIWFSNISEVQPLFSMSAPMTISVQLIGSAVVSCSFLIYLLFRSSKKADRNGWIFMAVFTVVFVLIALFQLRWAVYAQVLLSIVMAELLFRILQWRKDQGNILVRAVRKALVTLLFAICFLYAGVFAEGLIRPDEPAEAHEEVSLIPICQYLSEQVARQDQPLRILTHDNYAGEILYRTPHEVLGSNYHRNGAGIVDSYTIMTAVTDAEALGVIQKRQLDIILICPGLEGHYDNTHKEGASTFYWRLCQGQIPEWLKRVDLPEDLSEDFLMFETDF